MNEEISIMPIVVGALAVLYCRLRDRETPPPIARDLQRLRQAGKHDRSGPGASGGERPAQAVRARVKPRRGRPVDRANPTTRYWTNPVNASATNRQPEPTTDQGQSPPPLPEGVS